MSDSLEQFREAVKNNYYSEYQLMESVVMITDVDSPVYIIAESDVSQQEIDDTLCESGVGYCEELWFDTHENGFDYYYPERFEL